MNIALRGFNLGLAFKRGLICAPKYSLSTSAYSLSAAPAASTKSDLPPEFASQLADMEQSVKGYKDHVTSATQRWKSMNEIYYGKERDMTNFPTLKAAENQPKVRLAFIPENWFQAFYPKTGVTGAYIFFVGGPLFLISKEFWVPDHEFFEVIPFCIYLWILWRVLGPRMGKYFIDRMEKWKNFMYDKPLARERDVANKIKETLALEESRKKYGFQTFLAKKEMIDLQLEAAYRNRLIDAHKGVKSRLDYLVEKENTKRRFQQTYMVDWIINSVKKEITPQKEKEAMQKCIADLKALAQKSAATA